MNATMQELRTAEWGHWQITLWEGSKAVAVLPFPVGPQGPQSGFIGSRERQCWVEKCRIWRETGELPEDSLVWLGQEWLFDNDNPCPKSVWRDGKWISATRAGKGWVFPTG